MTKAVKPIPDGMHTVTPSLTVQGAAQAIDFYKRAFGAEERMRMEHEGSIIHAEIRIGDSVLFLNDENPNMGARSPKTLGGSPVSMVLYVEDVDALFRRAVDAGAEAKMPPADMFWGDRYAHVTDPFGHGWALATHKEDVTEDEMRRRSVAFFAQMAGGQGGA